MFIYSQIVLGAAMDYAIGSSAAMDFSKELALLHNMRENDGSPCTALFIDVGSHSGGSLWDWFTRLNCYESCGGNSTCRPENWRL